MKAEPHGPVAPSMKPFEVMKDAYVTVTATLVKHPPGHDLTVISVGS